MNRHNAALMGNLHECGATNNERAGTEVIGPSVRRIGVRGGSDPRFALTSVRCREPANGSGGHSFNGDRTGCNRKPRTSRIPNSPEASAERECSIEKKVF